MPAGPCRYVVIRSAYKRHGPRPVPRVHIIFCPFSPSYSLIDHAHPSTKTTFALVEGIQLGMPFMGLRGPNTAFSKGLIRGQVGRWAVADIRTTPRKMRCSRAQTENETRTG